MIHESQTTFGARFERMVDEGPDRLAIAAADRRLTYRETAELARRVARRVGATPAAAGEPPIALLMAHGPDAVVAIAGVLMGARGYAPLDPGLPRARLERMADLAGSTRILTDRANAELARDVAGDRAEVLVFEDIAAEPPAPRSIVPVDPEAVAILLFTSGSTGEPKAVAYPQRNALRGGDHFRATTTLTPEDRVSLITTFSYLPSTFCMFGPLLTGASVHPYDMRRSGVDGVLPWIKEQQISVLLTVPTVFRRVATRVADVDEIRFLRHVQLAGEPLLASDAALFRGHFPASAGLYNDMGATEIGCMARCRVDDGVAFQAGVAPVGYPYDDAEVMLKDDSGREVAPGEPGELFVKGRQVAHGYWRRPELSEGRFFPDPEDPEKWIYRTGDLAMRRPDGCLVMMGRKDDQVKINGVRVEPSEVQATLAGLPGVREALVLAPRTDRGERRLIAYLAGDRARLGGVAQVRAAAAEHLSMAMTPSSFVIMDEFPTTDSGKVDRKALPAPEDASARPASGPKAVDDGVRDALVSGIVASFRSTLKLNDIGANDDFFEKGGDSLLAVELICLLEERFDVKLPVSAIMEAATPARLAALVGARRRAGAPSGVVRLSGRNAEAEGFTPLFCIPGMGDHVLCYRHFVAALKARNPCYGLEYPGLEDGGEALDSIEAIADRFAGLIMETAPTGPVGLVGHSVGGSIAFETSRRLVAAGRETPVVALLDAFAPSVMRHYSPVEKAALMLRYMTDADQPDKLRTLTKRGRRFLDASLVKLRSGGGLRFGPARADQSDTPRAARTETIRRVSAACRRAAFDYAPEPFHQVVVQFRADAQKTIMSQVDCYSEWREITGGGLREVIVPAEHAEMLLPPAVGIVAKHIRRMLRAADASSDPVAEAVFAAE